ncbi:hypothetical protein [Pseudarthrobacter sp. BIM B-2242]|uniref:hypothetical protein n=1 Tax=Pseudarthrobacter sp. BIM B-2242 TaxID=2772401 RepID=UPI00168BE4BA|nr:hypothetical protein [Pseudarthrobacter sp. BIM B-2242]QOD05892.1 hypothetical protein IDT60_20190 [Pseudarthrobacter sp. BIM B-2242]
MTDANHKQSSPVVAFVRKNAVVVGVSAALLIGVGTYAANALQPERTAAPAPVPTINSTATLDGGAVASPTASPGSTDAAATGAPSAAPGASGGGQSGSGTAGGSAGQPGGGSGATPSAQPTTTVTLGTANQAPTLQDWKPTAEKFSAAWANPSVGKEAWLAAMKPYATEELLTSLARADIRNVPQDTLYNVRSVKNSERTWIFNPTFTSGKDRFGASITVQNDGSWLVDHVGAPE